MKLELKKNLGCFKNKLGSDDKGLKLQSMCSLSFSYGTASKEVGFGSWEEMAGRLLFIGACFIAMARDAGRYTLQQHWNKRARSFEDMKQ